MASHLPSVAKINKYGGGLCLVLVKGVREVLPWRAGDFVAMRVVGDKLVVERLALENAARIRTGEAQPYAAPLFEER
jgi:bifunctional DNA-binding transcriptional regulator/antitoxin component of YhaV-PrlF toxin-antitoxin module